MVLEEKITFMTYRGLYYYKVIPFWLKNTGPTYQHLVNMIFKDQIGYNMEVYVDDLLVNSHQIDHMANLDETF